MPLKTLVKVGNITNLSDARYCAGMGVEMLGFTVIEGEPNYINPKSFQEIRGWLSGPLVVAEGYGMTAASVSAIMENYQPDLLELSVADLVHIPQGMQVNLILSIIDKASFTSNRISIEAFRDHIKYLQVDQSIITDKFITELAGAYDILVTPANDTNILDLLENTTIKGIALRGSNEIKPGLKNYDHLASILEQLDVD